MKSFKINYGILSTRFEKPCVANLSFQLACDKLLKNLSVPGFIRFSTVMQCKLSSISSTNIPAKFYSTRSNYFETNIKNDTFFIKINRPEKRNCLNIESIKYLSKLLNEIDQFANIHKVLLYGEGGNFCSGFDLNELTEKNKEKLIDVLLNEHWFQSNKLLISYVEGFAVGLGFELALASDILIANNSSKFGFLNRRFGLPSFLPLHRYRNLVGRFRAIDLLDNAQIIDSKKANDLGLIKHLIHNESSLNKILNSIKIDYKKLKLEREKLSAYYKIDKFKDPPYEWVNHKLNELNYNLNSNRHGKYALSFWKHIDPS